MDWQIDIRPLKHKFLTQKIPIAVALILDDPNLKKYDSKLLQASLICKPHKNDNITKKHIIGRL